MADPGKECRDSITPMIQPQNATLPSWDWPINHHHTRPHPHPHPFTSKTKQTLGVGSTKTQINTNPSATRGRVKVGCRLKHRQLTPPNPTLTTLLVISTLYTHTPGLFTSFPPTHSTFLFFHRWFMLLRCIFVPYGSFHDHADVLPTLGCGDTSGQTFRTQCQTDQHFKWISMWILSGCSTFFTHLLFLLSFHTVCTVFCSLGLQYQWHCQSTNIKWVI